MRLATRRALPQGIAALLALTSPFAPPGNAASFKKDVVVRVLDDDKVKLEALGTVQLAGIRTPTRGVPDCYARVPFVRARALLPRGARVGVSFVEGGGAEIQLADGTSVNAALVREGYAKRRLRKNDDDALASALARAEAAAKREGAGIWTTCEADREVARPTFVATFDDVDFKPAPAKDFGDAPTVVRSCADFAAYEDALARYTRTTELRALLTHNAARGGVAIRLVRARWPATALTRAERPSERSVRASVHCARRWLLSS